MKKVYLFLIVLNSLALPTMAQLSLNFESGNRAIEQGNCWAFGSVSYSNLEFRINGNWSGRTNQLTNPSITASWIKTPWILPGTGNITMKARLENSSGTSRGIVLSYIPYDPSAPNAYKEGEKTTFSTYNFPTPLNIWIQDITFALPPELVNSQESYKILISFIGQGGNSRAFADDILIPGTYNSDPSNNCLPLVNIEDSDADGVADSEDAYPQDSFRAYNSVFPTTNNFGTLAFEDQWPGRGDYDFNDVVVDYRINTVTNAGNNVVEIIGQFKLKASGAGRSSGFAFQLDGIVSDKIISVSGNSISKTSNFSFNENGTENGQQYANVIVFDNFFSVMQRPGSGIGVNTSADAPFVEYQILTTTITFISEGTAAPGGTINISELSSDVFNYYIFSSQERSHEIHLADGIPTNLADISLFGTQDDDSNPAQGKYYKTSNNLPWGLHVLQGFEYPSEKNSIDDAYLYFNEWAVSSGSNYSDWFLDHPNYREGSKIY
ncbi:MAG: LruC domain-containing protein [Lentimicrobium sp.]